MRKTKIMKIGCMLVLSVILSSCSSKNNDKADVESTDNEIRKPIVESSIADYEEKKLDLEKYSVCNDDPTEANTSFLGFDVAGSDYGYYFWSESKSGYLMFYDKASEKAVPLCNRPECTHDNKDCNANYNTYSTNDIIFDSTYLQFYDGYLYILGLDTDGNMYLYRISEDGSTREQYMTLFKQDLTVPGEEGKSHYSSPEICIHKGYVYFKDEGQSIPKLQRIKLGDGSTVEDIFELNGERTIIYRVLPYGDYVFFQAGQFIDETYSDADAGIFAYNVQTGELQLVKADAIASYSIANDKLFYESSGVLYSMNLKNGEIINIMSTENKAGPIAVDSKYIYHMAFGSGILEVYNLQGECVCNVVDDYVMDSSYGDGEYLYGFGTDEENQIPFNCFLKVSDLATGNAKWQYIK